MSKTMAEVLHQEGAWCSNCEFEGWDACKDCRDTCEGYARALSAAGFGLVADAKAEASTSTQWGWRRSSKSDVRVVPSAYSAADVYHKLQDDGRTWRGVKYQIVSREITEWEWRETVAKTEGGKHAG